jgi:hypothetical protein
VRERERERDLNSGQDRGKKGKGEERRGVMKSGNEVYKKNERNIHKQKKNKKKDDGV